MKKTLKIAFFGNERLWTGITDNSTPVLVGLIQAGYEIVTVITKQAPLHKSRKPRELEIARVAKQHNIPLFTPNTKDELIEIIQKIDADIGVLSAFGMMVPESVIQHFRHGIVNVHPSLLPKYRGSTPIESAILDSPLTTGVSIMGLVKGMDSGPVFAWAEVVLNGNEKKQQLGETLQETGAKLLLETLPDIVAGNIVPGEQDESGATFCKQIKKEDGVINWNESAEMIERQIRAYANWPKSRSTIAGIDTIIISGHVVPTQCSDGPGDPEIIADTGVIIINCGLGALCIERLKPAGKAEMTTAEFINGYHLKNTDNNDYITLD